MYCYVVNHFVKYQLHVEPCELLDMMASFTKHNPSNAQKVPGPSWSNPQHQNSNHHYCLVFGPAEFTHLTWRNVSLYLTEWYKNCNPNALEYGNSELLQQLYI